MIIDKFKAIIEKVEKPIKTGKHTKQIIIVRKPSPADEFGDKSFPDDYFRVQVWNRSINKLPELKKDDKVIVFCQLNGRKEVTGNGFNFFLNLNAYKIELINK